jgi:hypothetical protein
MWLIIGLRTFFVWLGLIWLDKPLFYVANLFMIAQVVALGVYFYLLVIERPTLRKLVIPVYTALGVAYLLLFLRGEPTGGVVTYWGTEWSPCKSANTLFLLVIFPSALVGVLLVLVKKIVSSIKERKMKDAPILFSSLSILLYGVLGALSDAVGVAQGWRLLAVRIGLMGACLIGYVSFSHLESEES